MMLTMTETRERAEDYAFRVACRAANAAAQAVFDFYDGKRIASAVLAALAETASDTAFDNAYPDALSTYDPHNE